MIHDVLLKVEVRVGPYDGLFIESAVVGDNPIHQRLEQLQVRHIDPLGPWRTRKCDGHAYVGVVVRGVRRRHNERQMLSDSRLLFMCFTGSLGLLDLASRLASNPGFRTALRDIKLADVQHDFPKGFLERLRYAAEAPVDQSKSAGSGLARGEASAEDIHLRSTCHETQ